MLAKLQHPFVIRHHKTYISGEDTLSILMDYAANGTIHHLVRQSGTRLAENRIWKYAIQTILGLAYIHSNRIIHRDIKTLNLFLDTDDNIKIGDFGIARTLGDGTDLLRTIVGTPFYLSPGMHKYSIDVLFVQMLD
jgi:NIMA (never in mitosis gene a)-related kinase